MTPRDGGGAGTLRAASVLTILRKRDDGAWVLSRDANLLAASS
jgi:ketosteroid isomerase-like protein